MEVCIERVKSLWWTDFPHYWQLVFESIYFHGIFHLHSGTSVRGSESRRRCQSDRKRCCLFIAARKTLAYCNSTPHTVRHAAKVASKPKTNQLCRCSGRIGRSQAKVWCLSRPRTYYCTKPGQLIVICKRTRPLLSTIGARVAPSAPKKIQLTGGPHPKLTQYSVPSSILFLISSHLSQSIQ